MFDIILYYSIIWIFCYISLWGFEFIEFAYQKETHFTIFNKKLWKRIIDILIFDLIKHPKEALILAIAMPFITARIWYNGFERRKFHVVWYHTFKFWR